ncbi:MAG: OmpA family protein, partial [Treponema sp.]|nr:OmpA family protein [Treponema sp.]
EITTYEGNIYTFRGTAEAEVEDFTRTNDDDNMKKIQDKVEELGLENITVKKGEKGLTISLDKIQFQPDSAILMLSEKEKLNKIADILKGYNNDLLVTGHTALRGKEKDRQQLSEERAQSVADYLILLGVRDSYHIFTQGKGAREPIATNQTEAGRILNRRVEITIMDE